MKNFELMADLAETTLSASHAEDVLDQKERYYALKEKFCLLKKLAREERDGRLALADQNKSLKDDVARLTEQLSHRRRGAETDRPLNDRWRLESNVSLRTERRRRVERSSVDASSFAGELESLRARLLSAENESESMRKEKERSQRDFEVVVAQLRTISADNLLMKARLDRTTQEKLQVEKSLTTVRQELETAQQRLKQAQSEADLGARRVVELQARIDEATAKILHPSDTHFVYRVRRSSFLGQEELLMILRCKLNREIVIQFEAGDDQTFQLSFRDIKSIEKSVKTPAQIRITLKSLFSNVFEFEVADRERVLGDIKRFWQMFLAEPERGSGPGLDIFERIKGVLFDG